jgi:hypothetical protein
MSLAGDIARLYVNRKREEDKSSFQRKMNEKGQTKKSVISRFRWGAYASLGHTSAWLWIELMTGIELPRRNRKRYCSQGEKQCCTFRSPSYGTHYRGVL